MNIRWERRGCMYNCEYTGKDIPTDKQTAIFDRFVKFIQVTGMGLAISKSIAGQMGGETGVESEGTPGSRSRFWFSNTPATPGSRQTAQLILTTIL